MSVDWNTIRNTIHSWAAAKSTLGVNKIFWANQDNPRQPYPYGVLNIISDRTLGPGQSEYKYNVGTNLLDRTHYVYHMFTVSFQIYGKTFNARDYISLALAGLSAPDVQQSFSAVKLAYTRYSGVLDLSGVISGVYVNHMTVDIEFSAVFDVFDPTEPGTPYIETLKDVKGTFDGTSIIINSDLP